MGNFRQHLLQKPVNTKMLFTHNFIGWVDAFKSLRAAVIALSLMKKKIIKISLAAKIFSKCIFILLHRISKVGTLKIGRSKFSPKFCIHLNTKLRNTKHQFKSQMSDILRTTICEVLLSNKWITLWDICVWPWPWSLK